MITNINEMLDLYNRSFPNLQTDEKNFIEHLKLDDRSIAFEHRLDNLLVGYSVVNDDGILLLCVDESHRNKGIGTELLRVSEDHVKKSFDKISLGISRNTYLLCGVPMSDTYDYHTFFKRRGYLEKWISYDMVIDLSKYNRIPELDNKDDNIIIRPRRNDRDDIERLVIFGDTVDKWGQYYKEASDVIVAETKGEIVGAIIMDPDSCMFPLSLKGTGTIACLGVLKKYRKHGIGMKLCQEALSRLKDVGCKTCHIKTTFLIRIFISNSHQESGIYYQRHKLFYTT